MGYIGFVVLNVDSVHRGFGSIFFSRGMTGDCTQSVAIGKSKTIDDILNLHTFPMFFCSPSSCDHDMSVDSTYQDTDTNRSIIIGP